MSEHRRHKRSKLDEQAERVSADGRPAEEGRRPEGHDASVSEAVEAAFEAELAAARRQADENWDRYLRAEAELENQRKRLQRQVQQQAEAARRYLLERLLDIADNLERALHHSAAGDQSIAQGVEATYRELQRLLASEGVEPMSALGERFDPGLHEAVSVQPVRHAEDGLVVAEDRRGYTMRGELLRAARVVVGRHSEAA